jgi:DNA-binding beta-propeller fold protein YncE
LRHTSRFALILAILLSPASARMAAAAAPSFLGTFTSAGLCGPRGIGLSPSGDVFVGSDCGNPSQHMERFTATGGLLGTWSFPFGYRGSPNGVALDGSGNVFVTDYDGSRVHKFTSSGALLATWGTGPFSQPADIAVDGSGDWFVVYLGAKYVEKFTAGGSTIIGSAGTGPGQFQDPVGIALDASGRIYVADGGRVRILRFRANGSFDMEFTPAAAPTDVAVGPDGNIYVTHFYVGQVSQYSPSGALLLSFGSPSGLQGAFRIAISPTGTIFITEQHTNRITRFQIDRTTSATRLTFGRLKALYR